LSTAPTSQNFGTSRFSSCGIAAVVAPKFASPWLKACNPAARQSERREAVSDHVYNVLFLCTGNSARSILAESILRKDGAGRFRSFSAGSTPKGAVHPLALRVLEHMNYPTDGMRSKSWLEFASLGAPVMDFIFTVCDNAAGESCPIWPGQPTTAHWGIEDPADAEGTELEKEAAFTTAFRFLKNRIGAFASLPLHSIDVFKGPRLDSMDKHILGAKLREIGLLPGATGSGSKAS
jgi:arsenate reductase